MNFLTTAKAQLQTRFDAIFLNTQDSFLSEFTNRENNDVFTALGFTGSNGYALIMKENTFFFTDGRYTVQAKQELPAEFKICDISSFTETLKTEGIQNLYVDFSKISAKFAMSIEKTALQITLHHLKNAPSKPFVLNKNSYQINGGVSTEEKITKITQHLQKLNKDAIFIADPQNACWVLNIRGSDEPCTPIHKCTLLVRSDGLLETNPPLASITGNILVDSHTTYLQYNSILAEKEFSDFIINWKAIKNEFEIAGMEGAHKIDGIAVTNFLEWLEKNYIGKTEWQAASKLLEFRQKSGAFRGASFPTICGCNANGAIIHYNPTAEKSAAITENSIVLIDSGGQYQKGNILGTTDVTRTVFLGKNPPDAYKKAFTLVLKGHIALATAVFSKQTPSKELDAKARQPLLENGMNYPHSTGHGVGAFLSVHEGGCRISPKAEETLQAGMVLSNEHGYYLEGKFGIRIESLMLVKENTEGKLYFKTLTLAPIQESSIDFTMLTEAEQAWIVEYNKKCVANFSNNLFKN